MKSRSLTLANGIVGLAGGIILLLGMGFMVGGGVGAILFLNIIKLAILVLGIIAIIYYKGDIRVGAAPSVLLIVGGAIALIPMLGWVGGIISIVGGSLYLTKLKNFKVANN
ncbi:hypothetical protein [Furfurilactobacillus entadae]|uniref:hypothetical protein n=1 Tax=Furfurilactobacillus entadae TaxID=2922307 RepID=UPI0035EEB697